MIDVALPVLFRSPHELVVNKPPMLPSEAPFTPDRESVLGLVRRRYADAKLPHRLDAMTSGVLLIALTHEAIRFQNQQARDRRWRKLYVARVTADGPADGDLTGEHLLHLKRRGKRAEVVRAGGKRALLRVLSVAPDPSVPRARQALLELLTGRYHQIRVTLAHLGAPLIGDRLYSGPDGPTLLHHAALSFAPFGADAPTTVYAEHDAVAPLFADNARFAHDHARGL